VTANETQIKRKRGGQRGNRNAREESERFRVFTYEELMQRDKINVDIFWLRDESLEDSASLPDPDVIAREIMENLESAVDQFTAISQSFEQ
jgi:type I restriction enzyme M protein